MSGEGGGGGRGGGGGEGEGEGALAGAAVGAGGTGGCTKSRRSEAAPQVVATVTSGWRAARGVRRSPHHGHQEVYGTQ